MCLCHRIYIAHAGCALCICVGIGFTASVADAAFVYKTYITHAVFVCLCNVAHAVFVYRHRIITLLMLCLCPLGFTWPVVFMYRT